MRCPYDKTLLNLQIEGDEYRDPFRSDLVLDNQSERKDTYDCPTCGRSYHHHYNIIDGEEMCGFLEELGTKNPVTPYDSNILFENPEDFGC